jgi:carbamoyl-phosphate synthase large subunit
MNDIKVIVTAAGCPGASTFIRYLKEKVTERKIEITAVDMDGESIGRFISDRFYTVPPADDSKYIVEIKKLIDTVQPDVFFCVSSAEVPMVSAHKAELESIGTKVIVSAMDTIEIANNKYKLYKKLKNTPGVKIPEFYYPKTLDEFKESAKKLGYPEKRVCFKPHVSKGSRGFRIIDDTISRKDLLLNYKPDSLFISMDEFISIFEDQDEFPDFIIMEFVEGEEIDAMVLSWEGEALLTTCKTREKTRAGVIMTGELVRRDEIVTAAEKIIEQVPLDYNSGMQFKGGYLMEINTRVSTFIYQDDLIEPYLSIKLALGEITSNEIKQYADRIDYGRRMLRYMDQVFYREKDVGHELL